MIPRRTVQIPMLVRALLNAAAMSVGLALSAPGQAAVADQSVLQPTPLILKDGRIASVSVHVLSFPPGQSVLGPADAQRLDSLSVELATDCFLTAQVIGHVGSAEVGNDTLGAHRLARARADAVQASLIADGLPAKAIASVWDWEFMVREPRATLWVFRLTPGEDCEGKPLDASAPALVAGAELSPAAVPAGKPRATASLTSEAHAEEALSQVRTPELAAPAEAVRSPAPAAIVRAAEAPRPAATVPAGPAQAHAEVPRTVVAVPAGPAPARADVPQTVVAIPAGPAEVPAGAPSVTQALPAVSPNPVAEVAGGSDGAPPASEPDAESVAGAESQPVAREVPEVIADLPEPPAEPQAEPAAADAQELTITFPTNSSYFPPGTGTQLQALLSHLAEDQHYQVILQASVSGSKVVGAESPEEAAKYNQWLAERRVDRVRSWLDQNAAGHAVAVKPEFRANDELRQLVVRLVPAA